MGDGVSAGGISGTDWNFPSWTIQGRLLIIKAVTFLRLSEPRPEVRRKRKSLSALTMKGIIF